MVQDVLESGKHAIDAALERLLPRMHTRPVAENSHDNLRRLYEEATQPQLLAWIERNADRARLLSPEDLDELLSLQGTGGPLLITTGFGLDIWVTDTFGGKMYRFTPT